MAVIYAASLEEERGREPAALDRYIKGTARGDRDAFARLYGAASGAVYAYALSVTKCSQDAEDVLHDCFLNIYHAAPAYKSAGKPMAWIMTITKNLCLHALRDQRRRAILPEEDWERFLREREELNAEDRLTVRACMEQLKDEERRIMILHAVAGFRHREIAEFLDLPLSTVLSRYSRAAGKLKTILEKENFS